MEKLQFIRPGELTVELVQMTPMIHFQATEKGATLRATEVKPKLDRYLLHAAFHDNKAEYSKYLVGRAAKNEDASAALDYRLVIQADPNDFLLPIDLVIKTQKPGRDGRPRPITTFTGSIWDDKKLIQGSMLKINKTLHLIFRSKHNDLIAIIKEWIHSFFSCENFGQRQSKGFGSFLTKECAESNAAYEQALKKHMQQTLWEIPPEGMNVYHFNNMQARQATDWRLLLDDIKAMHHVLKSGENLYNPNPNMRKYTPSFLMKTYAKNDNRLKQFDNEKKLIKTDLLQKVPGLELPGYDDRPNAAAYIYDKKMLSPQQTNADKGRFLRALLGLAPFYEFRPIKLKNGIREYMTRINILDPAVKDPVARFRSPITYKPVFIQNKWQCYLIPVYLPDEMWGRTFELSIVPIERNNDLLNALDNTTKENVQKQKLTIKTPTREEFDLLQLLDAFCTGNGQRIRWRCNGGDTGIRTFQKTNIKKEEGGRSA